MDSRFQQVLVDARAIREQGGMVVVQDAASSVVWGMPGAVVQHGLHSAILTPEGIAEVLAVALYARTAG